MYLIIKSIADKYCIPPEVGDLILDFTVRNLFDEGYTDFKNQDKIIKKYFRTDARMKRYISGEYKVYSKMMLRLYYLNPRKSTFRSIDSGSRPIRDMRNCVPEICGREPIRHFREDAEMQNCYTRDMLNLGALSSHSLFGFNMKKPECYWWRGSYYILDADKVLKQDLIDYIEGDSMNYTKKLKKSYSKNQLINIILHDNPDYKLPEVITPKESSKKYLELHG